MSDPVIEAVETDVAKVKDWYKSYPFYAGFISGALCIGAILHFLKI